MLPRVGAKTCPGKPSEKVLTDAKLDAKSFQRAYGGEKLLPNQ